MTLRSRWSLLEFAGVHDSGWESSCAFQSEVPSTGSLPVKLRGMIGRTDELRLLHDKEGLGKAC